MGKNIINIALFGLGRIGQMQANNLINHKDFILKYIFDKDQKKKIYKNKKLRFKFDLHGFSLDEANQLSNEILQFLHINLYLMIS